MKILKAMIDLVYPPVCYSCSASSDKALCRECLRSIRFIEDPICLKCGKPVVREVGDCRDCRSQRMHFSAARSLAEYDGVVKEAVHAFKYRNARRLADLFAGLLQENLSDLIEDADIITFVPLRPAKKRQRGYNQAELLARALGRRTGKTASDTLKAVRFVKDQSKLKAADRRRNVRDAYAIKKGAEAALKGRKVLLVDDVFTTGATASECASHLAKAGAKEIKVITLARTL